MSSETRRDARLLETVVKGAVVSPARSRSGLEDTRSIFDARNGVQVSRGVVVKLYWRWLKLASELKMFCLTQQRVQRSNPGPETIYFTYPFFSILFSFPRNVLHSLT